MIAPEICRNCGQPIVGRWSRARYCSDRCKHTASMRRYRARMTAEQRAARAATQHRYHVKTYQPKAPRP